MTRVLPPQRDIDGERERERGGEIKGDLTFNIHFVRQGCGGLTKMFNIHFVRKGCGGESKIVILPQFLDVRCARNATPVTFREKYRKKSERKKGRDREREREKICRCEGAGK